MKRLKFFLMLFLSGVSAQSFAFIQAGLGGGYRGALAEKIGSGPQIKAFFHVDPIPFIPVSLGVGYTHVTIDNISELKTITQDLSLGQLDLELSAWLPFSVFSLTPYVRVATPLYSFFVGENAKSLDALSFNGFYGTAGLRWKFMPMFSIFAEGGVGFTDFKIDDKEGGLGYAIFGGIQVSL